MNCNIFDNINITDDEYYKVYTLYNILTNDSYNLQKPSSHQLRENILFQYFIEYKKMDKTELENSYIELVKNLKNKYKI